MHTNPLTGTGRTSLTFSPAAQLQLTKLIDVFSAAEGRRVTRSSVVSFAVEFLFKRFNEHMDRHALTIPAKVAEAPEDATDGRE